MNAYIRSKVARENIRAFPIDGVQTNGDDLDEDFAGLLDSGDEMIGDEGILLESAMEQQGALAVEQGRRLQGFLFLLDYDGRVLEMDGGFGGGGGGGHAVCNYLQ